MTVNLSYYAIPLVHLQTLFASLRGATIRLGFPNNVAPREVISEMEKSGKVKPHTIAKLKRRQAAHENCFENMGPFIGAVVAGNAVGLSTTWMNAMSITYFSLRCVYIWLYLNVTEQKKSYIRSVVYWGCNFCFLATYVKAGLKLNSGL
ncbi:hypothetical protein B9479_006051 [Cryptococcus floricola]|uniref:Uncharacterized protein n=1 Tax=Cryptococcus floricola TaxID=2591691 RepID=A0A5D3AU77_9TREE|nr:hypothetical protein B9479_006051 [Cryptococcus floricola]